MLFFIDKNKKIPLYLIILSNHPRRMTLPESKSVDTGTTRQKNN